MNSSICLPLIMIFITISHLIGYLGQSLFNPIILWLNRDDDLLKTIGNDLDVHLILLFLYLSDEVDKGVVF